MRKRKRLIRYRLAFLFFFSEQTTHQTYHNLFHVCHIKTVGARTTLEIQVETMKNEISVLMIKLDTVQRSYTEEVTTLEKNVRELRREQEKRLSDVSYKHFKDCDEMRRKLFHSQLEGDQYKLGKKGQVNEDKASMGKSPLADQNGVNRPKEPTTVKKEYRASSDEPQKPEKRKQFRIFRFLFKLCVYILFLCMLILSAGSGYYVSTCRRRMSLNELIALLYLYPWY